MTPIIGYLCTLFTLWQMYECCIIFFCQLTGIAVIVLLKAIAEAKSNNRELFRTKQMRFLRHLMRKDGLENLALTGKIEGKRSRGRKRSLWMANLNEWIGERGVKYQEVALFEKAVDRELWKSMIAHIIGYGT